MTRDGILIITVMALCTGCNGATVTPPLAPYPVLVAIDGGNAIVLTENDRTAVIGAVPQADSSHPDYAEYNDHRMDLVLEAGTRDTGAQFLAPTGSVGGFPYWRLVDYDVALCPGGQCPTAGALEPIVQQQPPTQCAAQAPADGNFYYVTNLMDLHPGSRLVADWRDRLESRLHLRQGRLYTANAIGCFTFLDQAGVEARRDSVVNGRSGLHNRFETAAAFVDVVFSRGGSVVGTVRITPAARGIQLHVSPTEHPDSDDHDQKTGRVRRLRPFYDLLDVGGAVQSTGGPLGRLEMFHTPWPPTTPAPHNPGGECPMIAFRAP